MDELRGALIGFGLAGSNFHAPLIDATAGLRLTTIVTANPERAARAAAEHPDARIEPSPDAIWKSREHDFVVVATPNDSHVPLARAAIDTGLAVVVDKPLAPTSAEAGALVEHAERAGVPLTAFHNRRWDSDQLTLRRLIDEGALGSIHRYESRFERWRPQLGGGVWRETTAAEQGGGVLLDIGTHLVDQALTLFGPAVAVQGEVDRRRGGAADDDDFVALEHAGGVRSHLWASVLAAAPGPRLRVLGSEAAYVVDGLDGQESALRSGARPGGAVAWGAEPRQRWGRIVRGDASEPVPSEAGGWPRFYELWEAALSGQGPLPVDPRDAVEALAVIERASGRASTS
jgi:predicted dehydrogenase